MHPDSTPLTFHSASAYAHRMYASATTNDVQIGLISHAASRWKKNKHPSQYFYGNSLTVPTHHEFALQRLGFVVSTALAIHLCDAKRGALTAARPVSPRPDPPPPVVPPPPGFPARPCATHAPAVAPLPPDPLGHLCSFLDDRYIECSSL